MFQETLESKFEKHQYLHKRTGFPRKCFGIPRDWGRQEWSVTEQPRIDRGHNSWLECYTSLDLSLQLSGITEMCLVCASDSSTEVSPYNTAKSS